jgi:hypothetical protein
MQRPAGINYVWSLSLSEFCRGETVDKIRTSWAGQALKLEGLRKADRRGSSGELRRGFIRRRRPAVKKLSSGMVFFLQHTLCSPSVILLGVVCVFERVPTVNPLQFGKSSVNCRSCSQSSCRNCTNWRSKHPVGKTCVLGEIAHESTRHRPFGPQAGPREIQDEENTDGRS